jgi:hypothetical protein
MFVCFFQQNAIFATGVCSSSRVDATGAGKGAAQKGNRHSTYFLCLSVDLTRLSLSGFVCVFCCDNSIVGYGDIRRNI